MSQDFYRLSILPYAAIIAKICRAYTHTQQDFEDYYQEVCLQIWRSRERFHQQAQWSTWIYRLTLNVCLTLDRKRKTAAKRALPEQLYASTEAQTDVNNQEDIANLYMAIKQLSELDRAVILLYLEQKSYKEIAEIMGTNPTNIGVRINRIKKRLKILLDGKIN